MSDKKAEQCEHDFSHLHPDETIRHSWYFCWKCNTGFNKHAYDEGIRNGIKKGRELEQTDIFGKSKIKEFQQGRNVLNKFVLEQIKEQARREGQESRILPACNCSGKPMVMHFCANCMEHARERGQKEGYKDCLIDNDLASAQDVYDNIEVVLPTEQESKGHCKHKEEIAGFCALCLEEARQAGQEQANKERFTKTKELIKQAKAEVLEDVLKIVKRHNMLGFIQEIEALQSKEKK